MWPLRFREPPHRTQPGLRYARRQQQRGRVHKQPVMTTSCGRRDKPTHQRATTGSHPGVASGVSQQESKTPSRGSLPFGGVRSADRCALACLPSAFRSQGFAPSQRFYPGTPSWLFFKPHPPLGFMGLQSFSHRGQPWCLSAPAALLPSGAPGHSRTSRLVLAHRTHPLGQAEQTAHDTPPEALAPELCSDRASDTPRDG